MEQPEDTPQVRKKEVIIGAIVVGVAALLIVTIAFIIYNSTPKIVYEPAKACDLFNGDEARELLGNKTVKSSDTEPAISKNTATSTCGYANGDANTETMIVAAAMVRSGINDEGVQQNKDEFAAGKPSKDIEEVKDLGESAYYNKSLGQLNILDGHRWIILSNGVGSAPQANSLKDAVTLAKKILN